MAGKKIQLTDEQLSDLPKLAGYGLTLDQIADLWGIGNRTLRKRMEEDEDIRALYKKGRAEVFSKVGATIAQRAMSGKDMGASYFYAKTQMGWRETNRHEVGGLDGQTIKVEFVKP
jgi:hypothetical protein